MSLRSKRVIAGILAFTALYTGGWAEFAPASFYHSFPGAGHRWISVLGPYDEHLVRDVGGLYLALCAVTVWAIIRPGALGFAQAGVGWLVFSVPHFVFHMFHLDTYGTADTIGNVVTLGGTLVLAALLLAPASTRSPAAGGAVPAAGKANAGKAR
jgi:hypothetical protein